jgi:hypothetical protein
VLLFTGAVDEIDRTVPLLTDVDSDETRGVEKLGINMVPDDDIVDDWKLLFEVTEISVALVRKFKLLDEEGLVANACTNDDEGPTFTR